jgi:DNA-binding MarR family transcriptional regulator
METKNHKPISEKEFHSIIIGKLMTISGILQRESNRLLLLYQLNQQQFSILFEIAKSKRVLQKNMVNRLLLERAHVSKVVKKLQTMGLIDIIPLPDDKRSAWLSPTTRGQELVDECRVLFSKWNKEWLGQFSAPELQQILDSVDKLQKAFLSKYPKQL